jgi:hypothetical protein
MPLMTLIVSITIRPHREWLGLTLLVCLVGLGSVAGATSAEFPQVTVGMGTGLGGLFHEESMGGAPRSTEMGRFAAAAYWLDAGYSLRSHLTAGLRGHYMRISLEEGGDIGTLDLLPVTAFIGYRYGVLQDRLRGFATIGAGVGSVRYLPSGEGFRWEAPGGGPPEVTHEYPAVLELTAGADVALSETLSFELGLASVFMDSNLAYQPAADEQSGEYVPERAYKVSGRHLLLLMGVRWWVELW